MHNYFSTKIDKQSSIFAIYDGHGGKEIAHYLEKNLISNLIKSKAFQTKEYSEALMNTFKAMDEQIMDKK
jgi:serine/threonine protein phosphatase PrpC